MSLYGDGFVVRSGDVGDFVWLNSHEWQIISESEARSQRSKAHVDGSPFQKVQCRRLRNGWDTQPRTFDRDTLDGTATESQTRAAIVPQVATAITFALTQT